MIRLSFLLLILLFSFKAKSQSDQVSIQALLDKEVANKCVKGAAAAYSIDGKTINQYVSGFSNEEENEMFNADTKVRMGSIAKTMTALAIMQLVESGRLDLDASIQTYIPDYPHNSETKITTRQLLSHTSGIGGYKDSKESNTKVEYETLYSALNLFKNRELLFEPGTRFSYTTYGYTVLGVIIENISGMSFEAFMRKNIWDKANMNDTGVDKFNVRMENESELYHRKKGKRKAKLSAENNLSNRIPAGGFYTTLNDMLKFGNAVLNNSFITKNTFDIMTQHHSLEKVNNSYGFGWFLYGQKPSVGDIIGHPGAQIGCTSFLFIHPKSKVVTIILSNTSRAQSAVDPLAALILQQAIEQAKN